MILLEKLDAKQRAVFILKEAFEYEHEEIASVLDISIDNSRKILSRARSALKMDSISKTMTVPPGYLSQYIDIIRTGDVKKLEQLLTDDIVLISDGGGKARAAQHPLLGKTPSLLFLSGIYRKFYSDKHIEMGMVNHQPALFFYVNGALVNCQVMEVVDEKIQRVWLMRNPDKLKNCHAANPSFVIDR